MNVQIRSENVMVRERFPHVRDKENRFDVPSFSWRYEG